MSIIILLLLILIYYFPKQVSELYSYTLGKILIYITLLMIAYKNNIEGTLLLIIFILIIHNIEIKKRSYLNNQVPLIKTSTTLIDLEQNLKPMDSKI
tara:strand:- start:1857 stop:2147 length:291 start_codon:yes stop_codon:yes gene_type:complete